MGLDGDELRWLGRVAEAYRALAMRLDPFECEKLDMAISDIEHARAKVVENPDRMVTAKEAAIELGVTIDMVNGWARANPDLIPKEKQNGRAYFHLGSLIEHRDRRRRGKSATSGM